MDLTPVSLVMGTSVLGCKFVWRALTLSVHFTDERCPITQNSLKHHIRCVFLYFALSLQFCVFFPLVFVQTKTNIMMCVYICLLVCLAFMQSSFDQVDNFLFSRLLTSLTAHNSPRLPTSTQTLYKHFIFLSMPYAY